MEIKGYDKYIMILKRYFYQIFLLLYSIYVSIIYFCAYKLNYQKVCLKKQGAS